MLKAKTCKKLQKSLRDPVHGVGYVCECSTHNKHHQLVRRQGRSQKYE